MLWFLHIHPRLLAVLLLTLVWACTLTGCNERASGETASVIDGEDSNQETVGDTSEDVPEDVPDETMDRTLTGDCDFWPGPRPQLHDRFGFTIPFSHEVTLEEQEGGTLFWSEEKGIHGYVLPLPGRYEDVADASTEVLSEWGRNGVPPLVEFSRRFAWDELAGVVGVGFIREPVSASHFIATSSGLDTSSLPGTPDAICEELRFTLQIGVDKQGDGALMLIAGCDPELTAWGTVHLRDWGGPGGSIRPVCQQETISWPVFKLDLLLVVDNSRSMAGEQQYVETILQETLQSLLQVCEDHRTCDARIAVTSTEAFLLDLPERSEELAHDEWLDWTTGLRGEGFVDELDGEVAGPLLATLALEDPGCLVEGWPEFTGANACGALDEDPYSSIMVVSQRLKEDSRPAFSWREDAAILAVVITDEPATLHSDSGLPLQPDTREFRARVAELEDWLSEELLFLILHGYAQWPAQGCEWAEGEEPVVGGLPLTDSEFELANQSNGGSSEICAGRGIEWLVNGPVGEPAVTLTLERPLNVGLRLQLDGEDWSDEVIEVDFDDRLLLWNYPERNGAIAEVGYWQWVER